MIIFVSGSLASSGFYYCFKKQNKGSEGLRQHLNLRRCVFNCRDKEEPYMN